MTDTHQRQTEWELRYQAGQTGCTAGRCRAGACSRCSCRPDARAADRSIVPCRICALFDDARWQWPQEARLEVPHPNGLVEYGFVIVRR